MMPIYVAILLLAFLSGITTFIGVALAFRFKKTKKGIVAGLGFSAGIMLLISFFELLPEAIAATSMLRALLALAAGFLIILLLNFILPHTHLIKEKSHTGKLMSLALLVAFGLILHDFPEGFAMANSYIFAPRLGILVALAIALHNIPEEFAMAVPLVLTKKRGFLFKMAWLSALAEPVGAVISLAAVAIAPALNPLFMAFAAGAMIFISIDELIPFAAKYKKPQHLVLGIALSVVVYLGLTILF